MLHKKFNILITLIKFSTKFKGTGDNLWNNIYSIKCYIICRNRWSINYILYLNN